MAAATAVADVVERQAARRRRVRIDGDAHGEFLLAEHQHLRDAGDLRNLLGEDLLGVVVDLATDGSVFETSAMNRIGLSAGIDLLEAGRRRQLRRQLAQGRRNVRLHVERRAVDVAVEVELHDDAGDAEARRRRHHRDAGDRREGALQRSGDRGGHRVGAGAGQLRR